MLAELTDDPTTSRKNISACKPHPQAAGTPSKCAPTLALDTETDEHTKSFRGIIGYNAAMLDVIELIRDLADTDFPVLIYGESGTGKELVASAIHNESSRAGKLFVPVNCGALSESLLESELFGYVKGAFTGAARDRKGRFELADGGTIFLDEIGDMPTAMQVKVLRVLQDGTFERVGGEETIKVDVRVISATNKDLSREIAAGKFRSDLYYRLSVVPLTLPPLRDRLDDIPMLAHHILQTALEETGKQPVTISVDAFSAMRAHEWPGNVRELQNWIRFSLVKCKGSVVLPKHLPTCRQGGAPLPLRTRRRKHLDIDSVRSALRSAKNKAEAAHMLGVSRATLYRYLLDITPQLNNA